MKQAIRLYKALLIKKAESYNPSVYEKSFSDFDGQLLYRTVVILFRDFMNLISNKLLIPKMEFTL